jgi:hypothetical protein
LAPTKQGTTSPLETKYSLCICGKLVLASQARIKHGLAFIHGPHLHGVVAHAVVLALGTLLLHLGNTCVKSSRTRRDHKRTASQHGFARKHSENHGARCWEEHALAAARRQPQIYADIPPTNHLLTHRCMVSLILGVHPFARVFFQPLWLRTWLACGDHHQTC